MRVVFSGVDVQVVRRGFDESGHVNLGDGSEFGGGLGILFRGAE